MIDAAPAEAEQVLTQVFHWTPESKNRLFKGAATLLGLNPSATVEQGGDQISSEGSHHYRVLEWHRLY